MYRFCFKIPPKSYGGNRDFLLFNGWRIQQDFLLHYKTYGSCHQLGIIYQPLKIKDLLFRPSKLYKVRIFDYFYFGFLGQETPSTLLRLISKEEQQCDKRYTETLTSVVYPRRRGTKLKPERHTEQNQSSYSVFTPTRSTVGYRVFQETRGRTSMEKILYSMYTLSRFNGLSMVVFGWISVR